MTMGMIMIASIAAAVSVTLMTWSVRRYIPEERVSISAYSVLRVRRVTGPGLGVTLASIIASLESGASIERALASITGSSVRITDSDGHLDPAQLCAVLRTCRSEGETKQQVIQVSCALVAARALSATLGCTLVHAIQAVRRAFLRMKLSDDLTKNAYAVPRATVRVLSGLPAVTLLLGELLGARPVTFLFGSLQGMLCLLLGVISYSVGLWWMRLLLNQAGTS